MFYVSFFYFFPLRVIPHYCSLRFHNTLTLSVCVYLLT